MLATISLAARRGNTSRDSVGMKPASTCGRFPLLSFLILSPFACLPSLQICFFRVRLTPHVCIESIWEYGVWVGGMTSSFVLFGNLNACNGTFRKPVRPCTGTVADVLEHCCSPNSGVHVDAPGTTIWNSFIGCPPSPISFSTTYLIGYPLPWRDPVDAQAYHTFRLSAPASSRPFYQATTKGGPHTNRLMFRSAHILCNV